MTTARLASKNAPSPASLRGRLRRDPRLTAPGWFLLPLRLFLAVTFVYAGSSKLFDPHYLDSGSPLGVRAQMAHAAAGSPIGWLVSASAGHSTTTGLLVAFGEVAVGLGLLLGLLTRFAAFGGMVLALSFFLTVSWATSPYYYGADIVFLFAFSPFAVAGDGGVLSVGSALRRTVRARMDLPPVPPLRETEAVRNEVERRTVVRSAALAAVVGAGTVVTGSIVALARRGSTGSPVAAAVGTPTATATPSARATASVAPAPTTQARVLAKVADLPLGSAKPFTDADGNPAYLLHPKQDTFVALSAVCTHQGCPVRYDGSGFRCPCHGATYDASGQVTGGPAPQPLAPIPVRVSGSDVVVA